jgi:RNA polymerase sigma-70 factor (ECF subfamily)
LSTIHQSEDRPSGALSFDQLYELYATDVLRVSYYYLGNRELAEDVTQDVFVKLISNSPDLETGHEKAWLLKVALNRCRDLWRSSWIKKVVLGHPGFECFPAPDDIGSMADKFSLAEAVNRLKPDFKEVVLLFYYQGFSVTEIAEMMNIAEGTVSSRLSRAREKLQKDLKGDDMQ